jgi:Zn-dependent protease
VDAKLIIDGLLLYIGLLVLLTFHEFGHAWTAWKCGDDTAYSQGRVSLNPIVHIDLLGTVVLPLLMIFLSPVAGFLVGWAKPVPVNTWNLRRKKVDDILVTLAGPGMNLLLAVVIMGLAKVGVVASAPVLATMFLQLAHLSLLLCFFNLLPIPPLDGSQVVRTLSGMSYETFYRMAQYGFFILIVVLQIPFVRMALATVTNTTFSYMGRAFGFPL